MPAAIDVGLVRANLAKALPLLPDLHGCDTSSRREVGAEKARLDQGDLPIGTFVDFAWTVRSPKWHGYLTIATELL